MPKYLLILGSLAGVAVLGFLGYVTIRLLEGDYCVSPGARGTLIAVISFGAAFCAAVWGGEAAVKFEIPVLTKPAQASAAGGIAVFLISLFVFSQVVFADNDVCSSDATTVVAPSINLFQSIAPPHHESNSRFFLQVRCGAESVETATYHRGIYYVTRHPPGSQPYSQILTGEPVFDHLKRYLRHSAEPGETFDENRIQELLDSWASPETTVVCGDARVGRKVTATVYERSPTGPRPIAGDSAVLNSDPVGQTLILEML